MTESKYEELRLGDLVSRLESGVSVRADSAPPAAGEVGVLKVSCLTGGRFDATESKRVPTGQILSLASPVRKGRVIISRSNTPELVGLCAYVSVDHPNLFLPDTLWQMEFSEERESDPRWLAYLLSSPAYREQLSRNASGTSANMKKLQKSSLLRMKIRVPPLPEQRKIAAILRTWDEAIEKLEALRVAKQKRLDGLTHVLIFGKLRTNGQRRSWQPTRLSEVTLELTARNTNLAMGYAAVMGVTKARGIVPMREQTIGGDLSRYKRLPPRAFAYNPMRINVGSIAMNDRDEEVLVSPDYVVFGCTENGLAPDFLDHLRKTHWWSHHINIGGSGSVRMRTYYDDLAAMKLPLPAYEEQLGIVAVLNAAQEDVESTEKASKALTRQKRGLMQKLLTGEWRVKR